ncbi:MAG: NACHT domain-containing protein, partial [Pirellula sp.]
MHGHLHKPRIAYNSDGSIRKIGLGAAYVTRVDSTANAPYRNSYTICKLTDKIEITGFSWDGYLGQWFDATNVQFNEGLVETNIEGGKILLTLPGSSDPKSKRTSSLSGIPRRSARPSWAAPLTTLKPGLWLGLATLSENLEKAISEVSVESLELVSRDGSKVTYQIQEGEQRHLLICIPGISHILSRKEVETLNTRFDSDHFKTVTVITFGKIAEDAKTLYLRLRSRKPIEVLTNIEITERSDVLLSSRQTELLRGEDYSKTKVAVLIDESETYLLNTTQSEGDATFSIIDRSGAPIAGSNPIVTALREAIPTFSKQRYITEVESQSELDFPTFNEAEYLADCHEKFKVMRYAALSSAGLRFSDLSFEDIYIEAKATEIETGHAFRMTDLLEDRLEAFPLSPSLKNQIKQQYGLAAAEQGRQETLEAQEFYQNYGAILVTGDPGSGKTCFVQNQILHYSRREVSEGNSDGRFDWYGDHIPVLLQLSQAVAESGYEDLGLLVIASRLCERQGFAISAEQLKELFDMGRVAFFFDGLDEVVSIEKRARVVQLINDLVEVGVAKGNRFVVTSRQAAVQVVDLLPSLHQLELTGLTAAEIRELARRILSLKLATSEEGVVVDDGEIDSDEESLLERIVYDCENNPGVSRIAKNPLLLTLLVFIYSNSGALSAKRHLIYSDAVRTLTSVRRIKAGHSSVSVQDLRERLGAVALSVYRKDSGFLPTLRDVNSIVERVMGETRRGPVHPEEAETFVRKVAESTGLIKIESIDGTFSDGSL